MLEFRLATTAEPRAARRLAKAAVAVIADSVCSPEVVHDFDLALTEACANVVRHAYPEGAPGPVEIVLRLFPKESVEAVVIDQGRGLPEGPPKDAPGPDDEGGRGLFIIQSLMDFASLTRQDGRTEMTMRKSVPGDVWASSCCANR